jgi:hypothetical protein
MFSIVVIPAICTFIIIGGLWHIDVSLHTDGKNIDYGYGLTNGFWKITPVQLYHIGLYMVSAGLLLFIIAYGLLFAKLLRKSYVSFS